MVETFKSPESTESSSQKELSWLYKEVQDSKETKYEGAAEKELFRLMDRIEAIQDEFEGIHAILDGKILNVSAGGDGRDTIYVTVKELNGNITKDIQIYPDRNNKNLMVIRNMDENSKEYLDEKKLSVSEGKNIISQIEQACKYVEEKTKDKKQESLI